MIKVIHFISDINTGGPEIFCRRLIKIFEKNTNFEFYIEKNGFNLFNLRVNQFNMYLKKFLYILEVFFNIFLILKLYIRKTNIIFHVHSSVNIAPVISGLLLGIPVIFHVHEVCSLSYLKFLAFIEKVFPNLTLCSSAISATSIKMYIPLIVESEYKKKFRLSKKRNKTINILSISNINKIKRIDYAIDALIKYEGATKINYTIVGKTLLSQKKIAEQLYQKVNNLQSNVSVKFISTFDVNTIATLFAKNDLFLITSSSEGGPTVLLEAMCAGMPIISTPVGFFEFFKLSRFGNFSIYLELPNLLLDRISKFQTLSDYQVKKISLLNMNFVEQNFCSEITYSKVLNLYTGLVFE